MKRNLHRKKIAENLDFVENGNLIRGGTEAGFHRVPLLIQRKKPLAESYQIKFIGR